MRGRSVGLLQLRVQDSDYQGFRLWLTKLRDPTAGTLRIRLNGRFSEYKPRT